MFSLSKEIRAPLPTTVSILFLCISVFAGIFGTHRDIVRERAPPPFMDGPGVQIITLGLELLGKTKDAARQDALSVLQQVGMEAFADNYPAQLSGGMQQRVLLARAIVLRPRLLLMDESMSSLDVLARRGLASLIKNYTRSHQAATLVVTHSVEEACFLADRILLVTRSPAKLYKEIRLSDNKGDGLLRSEAMNVVMRELWTALGATA